MKKTLLVTSSMDVTSDIFVRCAQGEVFRFNSDIMEDYKLEISTRGFHIQDPIGRVIDLDHITAVYWRKPMGGLSKMQNDTMTAAHEKEQRKHVCFDIAGICRDSEIWMLVDPWADGANTRSRQLRTAADLFNIPHWQIFCGVQFANQSPPAVVVKPLISVPFFDGSVLPVSQITSGNTLSAAHTWYVQDLIDATHDITVVWCCGKIFAYSLDRSQLEGQIDWRIHAATMGGHNHWIPCIVPIETTKAIQQLMSRLKLDFARLDFLRDRKGQWWFLEVNPNGQYAWLDLNGTAGMLDWVFDCAVRMPNCNY